MRQVVAAVIAVGLTFSISQPALASGTNLEPGVHVDPGSPAGKEYQIPVIGARSEAAGGSQGQGGNPPLFGVGVTPTSTTSGDSGAGQPGARRSGSGAAGSGSAHPNGSGGGSRARTGASSSPVRSEPVSAVDAPDPGGSSSDPAGGSGWIALVAGGLLVLVLGGGGGLALRRRMLHG